MNAGTPKDLSVDAMTREEALTLYDWAASEGWNPGLHDLDVAWAYDPDAFIAIRRNGDFLGGGSIYSYRGAAGFMGLFIMRPDRRRLGIGSVLWHERLTRLRARLAPNAPIGMDGVFDMVPFYEKGGFRFLYRDLRYQGIAQGAQDPGTVPLSQVDWGELTKYDQRHFPAARGEYLKGWLGQPGGFGLALPGDDGLHGYGFLRPCRIGFKLGPLFANDAGAGMRLLGSLLSLVKGEQVQWDIPEPNTAAVTLAEQMGWTCAFGCSRMVHGPDPQLPVNRIWGVTSLEFG